jgi:hypothetical protein
MYFVLNPDMEFNQKLEAGSPNESESKILVKNNQLCLTCLRMSVPQVLFKSRFRLEDSCLLPAEIYSQKINKKGEISVPDIILFLQWI